MLTPGERALVRSVFGEAIDPASVRLHNRVFWPFQPRRVVMAPMGDIHFHPEGGLFRDDFSRSGPAAQALFVHEMVHVWQAQCHGRYWLPLMRHPFCRYGYRLEPDKPFGRYGIEQQAEIVTHGWMLRQRTAGREGQAGAELAAYEDIVPFWRRSSAARLPI